MVILITGASHTGKTLLSQNLLEHLLFPCLSMDHLKMGLIRSGQTALTPYDDEALTPYLWSIVKEMIKTAIENGQNLIIEGCYIPFTWQQDFTEAYRKEIRYVCLVMCENYIKTHFQDIKYYANIIERRSDDSCCTERTLLRENAAYLKGCRQYGCRYYEITETYDPDAIRAFVLNS